MASNEVPLLHLEIDTRADAPTEEPQLPMESFTYTRSKMDELFLYWLSQKDTANLLRSILRDIEKGKDVQAPAIPSILASCFSTDASPSSRRVFVKESYTHGSSLPRSPVSRPIGGSTMSPTGRRAVSSPPLSPSPRSPVRRLPSMPSPPPKQAQQRRGKRLPLPHFFTAGEGGRGRGRRVAGDQLSVCAESLAKLWDSCTDGADTVTAQSFHELAKRCGLPNFFTRPLLRRINELFPSSSTQQAGAVSRQQFLQYWRAEVEPFDVCERTFRLIRRPGSSTIDRTDFLVLIEELLMFHPGLQFLENHAEFQEKYARTVATRILYSVNTSRTGRISLREFRRSDLMSAFRLVEAESDINRVTMYFSYEHFYVLYCRYWELDSDHDSAISREDLQRYGDHRLSMAIVDRIFSVGARPSCDGAGAQGRSPTMLFEDFIYFMLSEEDKGNRCSLQYWFECVDFDGDGVITPADMRMFYDVQAQRMASLDHDVVPFTDVLCQMSDMIKPEVIGRITLNDLLRPDIMHVAGTVFDALFNLDKFIEFEQRDPFAERQKRDDPFECDWDRFAYHEYNRLAQEEEDRENMETEPRELTY